MVAAHSSGVFFGEMTQRARRLVRGVRVLALLGVACSSGACFLISLDEHTVPGDAGSADEGVDVLPGVDATAGEAAADASADASADAPGDTAPFDARFRNPCTTGSEPFFCSDFDVPDAFGVWNGGSFGSTIAVSTNHASSPAQSLLTNVAAGGQAFLRHDFGMSQSITCIMDIFVAHLDGVANLANFGLGGDVMGVTMTVNPNPPNVFLRLYVNNGGMGRLVGGILSIPPAEWVRVQLTLAQPAVGGGPLETSLAVLTHDAGGQLDATLDAPNNTMSMRVGPHYAAAPAASDEVYFDNVACDKGNALP
jgi:hypothetical protein